MDAEDFSQDPLFNRDKLKELLEKRAFGAPPAASEPPMAPEPREAPRAPAAPGASPMEWSQVPGEAIKHLPESAAGVVSSMAAPILHPLETAEAVGSLAKGAYSKGAGALGMTQDPAEKAKSEQALNAVMDFYKQRYGSEEGLKQAIAKDPAGVAADLSALLTGGGSVMSRLPGMAGRAGEVMSAVGRAEPIGAAVSKATSAVTKPLAAAAAVPASVLFAVTTGKPIKTFMDAAKAGYTNNPEFRRHFSGEAGAEDLVSRVEGGLNKVADQRSKDYIAGMADPIKSQTPLGFGMVDAALVEAEKKFKNLGKVYNQEAKNAYDEALAKIDEWRNQPPQPGANALEDFDKLKRALSEVHGKYSRDFGAESPAAKIASDLRKSVFETIKKQDPRYADVMEQYERSSDKIKEIRKELLGGKTTSVGAKMRKILRSQNDQHKGKLLAELEAIDPDIGYALAGQELSSLVPQGLVGKIMAGGLPLAAGASTFNPAAILAGAASSPMLTGGAMYGLGAAGGLPARMPPSIAYAAGEARERRLEGRRAGRATGGGVKALTADRLISMAEAAKRNIGKHTEEILKAPDEHVVRALDIANKHI